MIYSKTNLETTKKISFILLHGGFEERVNYRTKESGKKLEQRDEKMKKREREQRNKRMNRRVEETRDQMDERNKWMKETDQRPNRQLNERRTNHER